MQRNSHQYGEEITDEISSPGVQTKIIKIDISGNGTVSLLESDKSEVHISGNARVSYKDDREELKSDISGNGSLIKL